MKSNHMGSFSRSTLGLYALVSFIAFAPCLLTGQSYFDNDLLAQFGPWRAFLKAQWSLGHLPLWNPYLLGGQPFFADPQNMMLYPLNWLTLPFSVPTGLTVFFLLHMFWAGLGMHLWLSSLDLSEKACRVGGLLFALSGFFWMELIHPPVLAAFSWLPWLFFSLEDLSKDPRPKRAFLAGLAFALLFLCGSFQVFLGGLYGGLAYFVYRAWVGAESLPPLKKGGRGGIRFFRLPKAFLLCALLFLWGALPLLGQLIPTMEFSARTNRQAPGLDNLGTSAKLSMNPLSLPQLLLPRSPLKPDESVAEALQTLDPQANLWPMLGYLGVWAPFLALLTLRGKRRPPTLFLILFAGVGLALSLGTFLPLYRICQAILPGFPLIRVPFRYLYLFTLGFSALAAFGYESWVSRKPQPGDLGFFKGALAYGFLLYLVALWRPSQNGREILGLGLGLAGLFIFERSKKIRAKGELLFQAALILPLLLSGWTCFQPGPSVNFDFPKNSSMLQELGKALTPSRAIFVGGTYYPIEVGGKKYALPYPQNAAAAIGLKNFGGYDPLALRSKGDLGRLPLATTAKLGAIRTIISQQDNLVFPGFTRRTLPPYQLYEWQGPMPYVFMPSNPEFLRDQTEVIERMTDPIFDPYQTVLLSEVGKREILCCVNWKPVQYKYDLQEDAPDFQLFTLELDKPRLAVFSETMFPGWKARVDGRITEIFTADHFLRSLIVPEGNHRVEFRFEPFWWPTIPIGLGLWLLSTILVALLTRIQPSPLPKGGQGGFRATRKSNSPWVPLFQRGKK